MQCVLEVRDIGTLHGIPCYSITRDGKTVITSSRLGLILKDGQPEATALAQNLTIVSVTTSVHDSTWQPIYGERSSIHDHYHQVTVTLRHAGSPGIELAIDVRAYDAGIAFCYRVPKQEGVDVLRIQREQSEFRFAGDLDAWAVYSAQGVYQKTRLSKLKRGCERPLVLREAGGAYLAVAEARLVDYARMKLAPLAGHRHALVSDLTGTANCSSDD